MTGTAMLERMLSPSQIEVGLHEIADIAKRANVRVILIGGVALQAYGGVASRSTSMSPLKADSQSSPKSHRCLSADTRAIPRVVCR